MHSVALAQEDWWTVEPGSVIGLIVLLILYWRGYYKFCRAGLRRIFRGPARCFAAGWLLLSIALISPVHSLGSWLFWVHMTQHELLMVAAAPLFIAGRIGLVSLKGFSVAVARGISGALEKSGLRAVYEWLRRPLIGFVVQTGVLWIWHTPTLFNAALRSPWIHACEHAYFFGAALFFWDCILSPRTQAAPVSVFMSLFLTTIQCTALGALLALSPTAWYEFYLNRSPIWGITAVADQQMGGLIMWIPSGVVYIVVALVLAKRWLSPRMRGSGAFETAPLCAAPSADGQFPV